MYLSTKAKATKAKDAPSVRAVMVARVGER